MTRGHIEISGAGLAGLTAAAAFAQRGFTVRVHERSPELRAAGSGIFIFENGLRVLRAIGAHDEAIAGGHLLTVRETRAARGDVVSRYQFRAEGDRTYTIVRQQLLEALANAACRSGAEIVLGSEGVAADPEGALVLADGTRCPADLVIAADGVYSRIRDQLGLIKSRKKLEDGAIRVLIPRTPEELASDEGQYIVEHWSGKRRLLYVPCSREWLYLALTTVLEDQEGQALPLNVASWTASFPHLDALIARIGPQGRWDPFEVIHLHRWSKGRVAVVGDASHAQPPNLGQGGGCAMMNALALAVAMERHAEPLAALEHWERTERPLTEHTQRVSTFYSVIGAWPERMRSLAFGIAGRSRWMVKQRMKTAHHHPTGT
jgi:2-polyprenyl-6-methoxyphenol hydroxylase-like FAD-dependent oxidoreductase